MSLRANTILRRLNSLAIAVKPDGDKLRLTADATIPDALLAEVREAKIEILDVLAERERRQCEPIGLTAWQSTACNPSPPCPVCGGVLFWRTVSDDREGRESRCETCDPPSASVIRIIGRIAARIPRPTMAEIEAGWGSSFEDGEEPDPP